MGGETDRKEGRKRRKQREEGRMGKKRERRVSLALLLFVNSEEKKHPETQ